MPSTNNLLYLSNQFCRSYLQGHPGLTQPKLAPIQTCQVCCFQNKDPHRLKFSILDLFESFSKIVIFKPVVNKVIPPFFYH